MSNPIYKTFLQQKGRRPKVPFEVGMGATYTKYHACVHQHLLRFRVAIMIPPFHIFCYCLCFEVDIEPPNPSADSPLFPSLSLSLCFSFSTVIFKCSQVTRFTHRRRCNGLEEIMRKAQSVPGRT